MELSKTLDGIGADYLFHFSKLSEAGGFGSGSAVVGKLSYKSLVRIIRKNGVDAIIDIKRVPKSRESLVALNVAGDLNMPLIKVIVPTVPPDLSVSADPDKVRCSIDYSYESIAAKINNTVGSAVFLANPVNVRPIADLVFDRNALYTPVPAASDFDVELALEYGIPLLNVREYDDFSGREGIRRVLSDAEARLLITDSVLDVSDKLSAASDVGAEVIFTQTSGYDYENIFDNYDALCEFLRDRGLYGEEQHYENSD